MKKILLLFSVLFLFSATCIAMQEKDVGDKVEKVSNQDFEKSQALPLGMVLVPVENEQSLVSVEQTVIKPDHGNSDFFDQFAPKDVGWQSKNQPLKATKVSNTITGSAGGNPGSYR